MTPEYAAEQLLTHGALTTQEFLECTGWSRAQAQGVLNRLIDRGIVTVLSDRSQHSQRYWLTRYLPADAIPSKAVGRRAVVELKPPKTVRRRPSPKPARPNLRLVA